MGAVRMCAAANLRRRLGGTLAVALLVALVGGVVLAAAAGARRTESAYSRMARFTNAADATVGPNGFGKLDPAEVATLPGVDRVGAVAGFGMADRPKVGLVPPNDDYAGDFAVASADGVAGYQIDRLLVVDGRMPRPGRVDETVVNEAFARSKHLGVGDHYDAVIYSFAALQDLGATLDAAGRDPTEAEAASVFVPVRLRITGIGRFRGDLTTIDNADSQSLLLTPAFARAHPEQVSYVAAFVTLRDPAGGAAALGAAARTQFPDQSVDVQTLGADLRTFQRTVTPYATALWLFALVALVAGVLVVGQLLLRLVAADNAERSSLHALGATRAQRAAVAATRATVAVAIGTALAFVLALAASPLFPLGRSADAEPRPGLSFDPLVLGAGLAAFAVVLALFVGVAAWWRAGQSAAAAATWSPSRTAEGLARQGASVSAVCGVRFALQRRPGPDGLSLATTVFGLVAAVAALGAALVFATNLDRLVTTPAQYGWRWDALVDTYDLGIQPEFAAAVTGDRDFTQLTQGARATFVLDGRPVPAFGFEAVRGDLHPEVTAGRWPSAPDEVALGAQTLRGLGADIGDRVAVGAPDGRRVVLEIVGRTIVPSLNLNGSYGVGEGAAMTAEGLARVDPSTQASFYLANLRPGALIDAVNRRYDATASVLATKQPIDINSYARVRATPFLLAGMLALLGVGVLVHLLVMSIRQRRRDLAILKTIGFSRRQVGVAVAWQASTLAVVAVAIGVPVGLLLGGWTWRRFAIGLGVDPSTLVPVLGLLAIAVAAFLLSNLIAIGPARAASRVRPALVLRSE
jgi:putative ABC transport system permease protein